MATLADDLKKEAELLRRRIVHHTRPKGPLAMEQARDLCRQVEGTTMIQPQSHDAWDYFNFDLIMKEAKMRHTNAVLSTAAAITPEMRSLNYWVAWCAHANAAACLEALEQEGLTRGP